MATRRIEFFDGYESSTTPDIVIPSGPAGAPGDWDWQGEWISQDYTENQVVKYNGSVYLCHTNTTSSQVPTDMTYWELAVEQGEQGEQGPQGIQGVQGIPGTALNGALVSSSTTLTGDMIYFIDSSSGPLTLTLPTPTLGQQIILKDTGSASSNNITISGSIASGSLGHTTLDSDNMALFFAADGTNWHLTSYSYI